jgi:integrase/recombinase XerD
MKHLSLDQVYSLLQATPSDRDRLMLQIGYEHGLRVSELCRLTPSDVKNGYLCTNPGKHGVKTVQKLNPSTLAKWEQACIALDQAAKVFPITRQRAHQIFHNSANRAGIALAPRQGIHSLRHSIAHHLLDNGESLNVVQRKLGHKSLASTGQYLKTDDSAVDQACERLWRNQ